MMKTHKASRLRLLGGAATVAALAGVSLALGTPGFAAQQETPKAEAPKQGETTSTRERSEERVIIHRIERGEHANGTPSGASPEGGDRERRVIIMEHGDGDRAQGHAAHGDGRVHTFRFERGNGERGAAGAHGDHVALADCAGGQATEVNEGDASDRTRVVLCSRGNATPAERAERLQRARDRLAGDSELSAEAKARVTAALDREIARLRGQ